MVNWLKLFLGEILAASLQSLSKNDALWALFGTAADKHKSITVAHFGRKCDVKRNIFEKRINKPKFIIC